MDGSNCETTLLDLRRRPKLPLAGDIDEEAIAAAVLGKQNFGGSAGSCLEPHLHASEDCLAALCVQQA